MRNNLHCQVRARKWQHWEEGCTSKLMVSRASAFSLKYVSIILLQLPIRAAEKQYNLGGDMPRLLTFDARKDNSVLSTNGVPWYQCSEQSVPELSHPFQCTSVKDWDKFLCPSPRDISHCATTLAGYQ